MIKILYVPLDERPCNYRYPKFISEMTDNIEMKVPPKEFLGKLKNPANVERLWEWVFDNVADCSYAILSIDMLVYGNIINSRIHNLSEDKCIRYLNRLELIKKINCKIQIHAFNLVARVANCNNSYEDPDYWSQYGTQIWKYSYLMDKINRSQSNKCDEKEYQELKETIPSEYLNNFLERRKVDRSINLKCIELVNRKIIDYLVIPKDDTAEFGFAAIDQSVITKKIQEYDLANRIMVYPGADEVGCILFARIFTIINKYIPKVYIRYSSTLGPVIIPKYEDRPLNEGIKAQIASVGGICVDSAKESDFLFAVHSPGKFMIESFEQYNKDVSCYSHNNLHEFLRYIKYYSEKYHKEVAIADVAFCNGADNELMSYVIKVGLLDKICAYGGWNTAQNTIGVVLAQVVVSSYYELTTNNNNMKINTKSEEFLLRKLVEDWLFQSNVLHNMLMHKNNFPNINPYEVGDYKQQVLDYIKQQIEMILKKKIGKDYNGSNIILNNWALPWDRIFEIDFDIRLSKMELKDKD